MNEFHCIFLTATDNVFIPCTIQIKRQNQETFAVTKSVLIDFIFVVNSAYFRKYFRFLHFIFTKNVQLVFYDCFFL